MGEWLLKWWPIIGSLFGTVISILVGWIAWSAKKQFVTHDDFTAFRDEHSAEHGKIDAALANGDAEFRVIRTRLENLPSRQEIEETVGRAVAPLAVSIEAVKTSTDGIQELFQTLLNHELAEARQAKAKGNL
jgi:hypothetical protein